MDSPELFQTNCIEGMLWEESDREIQRKRIKTSNMIMLLLCFILPFFFVPVFLMFILFKPITVYGLDATFRIDTCGIEMSTKKKKKYEKYFLWEEVVEIREIIVLTRYDYHTPCLFRYLAIMRKPQEELNLMCAREKRDAYETYRALFQNQDIIAIPKTDMAVQFIERFKHITPLPERFC